MTPTWQRRAVGTIGLVALLGITILMLLGPGSRVIHSLPDASLSVASVAEHSAFIALPDSRPTFAFVETLTLLGLAAVVLAIPSGHRCVGALIDGADGVVRHRRWRARLVGAPPFLS